MESSDKPGKFSMEARFQVQTPKGIRCMICPNECSIPEGASGDCGNRRNFNGTLFSIAYGNPCSVHITPLHFSRFHPEYRLTQVPATPVETLVMARNLALEAGLHFVYIGNVPNTDAENTSCPSCHKTVIVRKGYRILQSDLVSGKCRHCGHVIPGHWS